MEEAQSVILSTIESLNYWLLKKNGILNDSLDKLHSLIVEMSDLDEEDKEMVHSLFQQFRMEEDEGDGDEDEEEEEHDEGNGDGDEESEEEEEGKGEEEDDEEKDNQDEEDEEEEEDFEEILYNLLDLNKEKMYNLVVGMADFWEDHKEKLYRLLVRVRPLTSAISLVNLVVEIVDLWEDDEGELNKEKPHSLVDKGELHSLLCKMCRMKNRQHDSDKPYCSNMRRLSGDVVGLWKDKQPKLNKEKLYTWLANKVDLCEPNYLFPVLFKTLANNVDSHHSRRAGEKLAIDGARKAKRELGKILDLITDKKLGEENSLRYFISDVVDMAHRACVLIQLEDSGPFTLVNEFSELVQGYTLGTYHKWFSTKFNRIANDLQEIKVSLLGLRVERLQNVRELEGRENVVGLEDDVNLLLYGEGNSEITAIRGTAGIGKTTLARQVYHHKTITQQFKRRAWVYLSKVFSRKEVLVSIVRQMVDSSQFALLEKIECADYEFLKQVLHQQLLDMQYFIVLDNVSCTPHLEYVIKALPKDRYGSRLLLTTRNTPYLGYKYYSHYMKFMDDDKSWTLLLRTLSIEGSDEIPGPLVKYAKQILRKCGGLPLAIKEVGRNWAIKRGSRSEWQEVIKSIDITETLVTLEQVYHDWNKELQSHFLHLAFFKEGVPIKAKRLIHIWIILGVVSDIEKEYENNLYDLSRESVIDIDSDVKGNIKTCCVHPVFHMLSVILAQDELKFEILPKDGNSRPSRPSHHRAIYCSREMLMNYSSNQDNHIVSLFLYGGCHFNASPSYWNHFEQLEILDMEDFGLKILPDAIGMLSKLIYLGLRNNYLQELPHSLSRLKKLEVLDIALNFMVEVENILWKMGNLCHLYMSNISCRKPLRMDTLKHLQTWKYVSAHNWVYEASGLEMMTSLTKLGIQEVDGNTNLSKLFASLSGFEHLDFLILRGFRFKNMPSLDEIGILWGLRELKLDGLITRLPSANNFPQNIERLSLINTCLHEDPMPILEKLPNMIFLKLQNAYTGQQMVISRKGFSSLEFLVIEELWHLTNIQIRKGAMKSLKHLEINSCPNLDTLPEKNAT